MPRVLLWSLIGSLVAVCGSARPIGAASAAGHWAYQRPVRPRLPQVSHPSWAAGPIDRLVLARIEQHGFEPSPVADPARLIRRVYFDLIGLPPTIDAVDRFMADPSDSAYVRIVDRLLASPRLGEKWARHWLDLARYADSNGFQADQLRDSWAYRDWVIRAINADMPFDRFTIEQVAGDLLPHATLDDRIATGFHRTPTCNVEAGVDPEENRVNQVFDRVNTTGTVWLGTTLECAQCHDHKFDPITQREYYQLFAFFNNTPLEVKLGDGAVRYDFVGPKLALPQPAEQVARRKRLEAERRSCAEELKRCVAANKKGPSDQLGGRIEQHRKRLAALDHRIKAVAPRTTLVMVEVAPPRATHVLRRGDFQSPGEQVQPGVPKCLPPLPDRAPRNRLGLAKWLVDPGNPLVGRVTVNRWWSEIFGRGLVATSEDFGRMGDRPTHPQLLDYLALQLTGQSWSMKALLRRIVLSATYRQASRADREEGETDPDNRWMARGPRFRLPAETLRDNALAISGLLCQRMEGPPIFPPQPPHLWRQIGRNEPRYVVATGEDRFRRGIYVVWRRASPYPSFINFDATDRTRCVVARSRTNTPLQALSLMNDPVSVECAKALAARMLCDPPARATDRQRVTYGFRRAVARWPSEEEVRALLALHRQSQQRFADQPGAAQALIGNVARYVPAGSALATRPWAGWFSVATVLLNLDETITKE